MTNYPEYANIICDQGCVHRYIVCVGCGNVDVNGTGAGYVRMVPPLATLNAAMDCFACINCLHKMNTILGSDFRASLDAIPDDNPKYFDWIEGKNFT